METKVVGSTGLEPVNSEEGRFTVFCNCRYTNYPIKMAEVDGLEPSTIRLTGERSAIELHFSCSAKVGIAPTTRGSSDELQRILN